MRAWLLFAILCVVPATSAQFTWSVPEEVGTNQVAFAAYEIVAGEGLEGHVDIELQVWLDDALLAKTTYLHEHDGAFPLTIMPPAPGTLRFVAVRDGTAVEATTNVVARNGTHIQGGISLDGSADIVPAQEQLSLIEMRSSRGDLLFSVWSDHAATANGGQGHAVAWTVGTDDTIGAAYSELAIPDPISIYFSGGPDASPPCGADIVLDPPASGGIYSFQEGVNVRAFHRGGGPVGYSEAGTGSFTHVAGREETGFAALARDPFGQAAFRPGAIGAHTLQVQHGGEWCNVPYTVTAAPASTGTVEADIVPGPGSLNISFVPVDDMGNKLGHYEFDTRVIRHQDDTGPGRLAFVGKMHGHAGDVRLILENLESGKYTIVTYPSPQGASTPRMADGQSFVYHAVVPEGATHWSMPAAEAPGEDAPALPFVALIGLLVLTMRRR